MTFHDKIITLEPVNLFDYKNEMPELLALEQTEQEPKWHAEGNVLIHTNMVLEKILPVCQEIPNKALAVNLYLGCLLHDIGKPKATFRKEDGRVVAYDHEGMGVPVAREFLRKYFPEFNFAKREWIVSLVEYHGHPKRMIKDQSSVSRLQRLSLEVDTKIIYLLEIADFTGRIGESNEISLGYLETFKSICEANNIFGRYYEIPNSQWMSQEGYNLARWKILFNGKSDVDQDFLKQCDKKMLASKPFELMIAVGCPGSGKTTITRNVYPHVNRVSMDDMREELTGNPNDQTRNQEVFTKCYSKLISSMKNRENTIWDATSADRKIRRKVIEVARQHGALVTILYFDIPLAVALERNANREKRVPDEVVQRFFNRLQMPKPYEYDRLLVVDENTPLPEKL